MSSIQPVGSALRKAVRYVSDRLAEGDSLSLMEIVDRATLEFDLNPNQAEYLLRFYRTPGARGTKKGEPGT